MKSKTVVVSIRLPEDLLKAIKEVSTRNGQPYQTWIKEQLSQVVSENYREEKPVSSASVTLSGSLGMQVLQQGKAMLWDVRNKAFAPKDLGFDAKKHGSFSDYAINGLTASSRYRRQQYFKPIEFNSAGRPSKYVLVFNEIRLFKISDSELGLGYSEFDGFRHGEGYSFELLGLGGHPDLSLVCCQEFVSKEEAQRAAKELLAMKFTHLPAYLNCFFLENTSAHQRVNIEAHPSQTGTIFSVAWHFGPTIGEIGPTNFRAAISLACRKMGWELQDKD